MSIFNDKALKGVSEAVAKIMEAEKAKMDYDKDGKVESPKAEVLGSRIRAAKLAGKLKEDIKKNEYHVSKTHKFPTKDEHAVTVKHTESGREHVHTGKGKYLSKLIKTRYNVSHHFEDVELNDVNQLDEAFPTVADGEKSLKAKEGKTSSGTVTKTKTGLVHKRDYKDDDNDADDTQKKSKGYGARQNFKRSTRVNEQKLSFTEMLELYNEAGIEVIAKIMPEKVKFGDTEVEVIDANIVNGAVAVTVAEEVDNETFTKEVEAQKEKNAGKGKKAEVAKASVQAVEVQKEEVELEERAKWRTSSIAHNTGYRKDGAHGGIENTADTGKEDLLRGRFMHSRYGSPTKSDVKMLKKSITKNLSQMKKEEVEQIDELSKATLGSYVKKSKADAKAHYQDFKSGKNSPDPEDRRLSMHSLGQHVKRTQGLKKADARLGNPIGASLKKEEVEQIDEISKELAGKYLTAPQGKGANKYKTGEGESTYPNWSALSKHQKNVKRALQRSGSSSLNKKPSYYKEDVEQLDELSKATLGSYVKKSKADAKAHYQDFKSGKNSPDPEDRRLSMHSLGQHVKRTQGLKKADARLGEEVEQLDEKLPASASAGDYIHDFVHSDNPKFAGKSTKERQKMALGAFYAKNKGK